VRINYLESFELETGRVVDVDIELIVIHDPSYGADADGNRGTSTRILDDYDYTCLEQLTNEERLQLDKIVLGFIEKQILEGELFTEDVWR